MTIEQPIRNRKRHCQRLRQGASVLLECLSNLTANEMSLSEDTKKQTRSYTEVTDFVVEEDPEPETKGRTFRDRNQ